MFSDAFQWHIPTPRRGDYLTVIVDLLRPLSRAGSVTLASADARTPPSVNINFLSEHLDIVALREGVRFVDDIIRSGEGMRDLLANDTDADGGADYPWPMPRTSDEAMNKMILERMQTGFRKFSPVTTG